MRELFAYYRVRNANTTSAREAVGAMQDDLRAARPGLLARLLVRQGEVDGLQTWMEIYSAAPGSAGIDVAFEALIESRSKALAPFIDGVRQVEAFDAEADL